jgi:hypothetical protein
MSRELLETLDDVIEGSEEDKELGDALRARLRATLASFRKDMLSATQVITAIRSSVDITEAASALTMFIREQTGQEAKAHTVAWPHGLYLVYNGSSEPCDVLLGHCSCGAVHTEAELHERINASVPDKSRAEKLNTELAMYKLDNERLRNNNRDLNELKLAIKALVEKKD